MLDIPRAPVVSTGEPPTLDNVSSAQNNENDGLETVFRLSTDLDKILDDGSNKEPLLFRMTQSTR